MTQITVDLEKLDVKYDVENDVIYVSFGSPEKADDSEMLSNGIVVRYRNGKPIGLNVVGSRSSE
jgi:uncharacterized protein YuzE